MKHVGYIVPTTFQDGSHKLFIGQSWFDFLEIILLLKWIHLFFTILWIKYLGLILSEKGKGVLLPR